MWPCYATFNYRFLSCTLEGTKGGGVRASYLDAQEFFFSSDFALGKETVFFNHVVESMGVNRLLFYYFIRTVLCL